MKGRAALFLCIVYFAPPIRHQLWNRYHFHLHQHHNNHHHHNHNHHHHHHQLNNIIFVWLFLKTPVKITKYVTSIKKIYSLLLNHQFRKCIAPVLPKCSEDQTIQSCLFFRSGCIKWSWFILRWCAITCHTYIVFTDGSTPKAPLCIVLML